MRSQLFVRPAGRFVAEPEKALAPVKRAGYSIFMQHNIRVSVKLSDGVFTARITRNGRVTLTSARGSTSAAAVADAVRNFRTMIRAER